MRADTDTPPTPTAAAGPDRVEPGPVRHPAPDASPSIVPTGVYGTIEIGRGSIVDLEQRCAHLTSALVRAENILSNMALENTTGWRGIFARWPIHHEPLRNDAQRALPMIRAVLQMKDDD